MLLDMERLCCPARLQDAWHHIEARNAGAGVDGVSVEAFAAEAPERLARLRDQLLAGQWRPAPARRIVLVDDPDREIGMPTVADRVVHRLVAVALSAHIDGELSEASHAYRPRRGVDEALARVDRWLADGYRWYARTDIVKFFDRIDRDRLLARLVARDVAPAVARVVEAILEAGMVEHGVWRDRQLGVPQGSALSPVLSNLYLDELDDAITSAGIGYIRYADDILLLEDDETGIDQALLLLRKQVQALGLELNPRKTMLGHLGGGFSFLGKRFDSSGRRIAASAWKALEEAAVSALATQHRVPVDLLDAWVEWYGPIEPAQATTPGVLALAALVAQERGDEDTLLALGERVGAVPLADALPPHFAARLATAWVGLSESTLMPGVALAARALRANVSGVDRADLLAVLGVPARVADRLPPDPATAAARLRECGATRIADAWEAAAREEARAADVDNTTFFAAFVAWVDALGIHRDRHAVVRADGMARSEDLPLTHALLQKHLDGRVPIAVFPLAGSRRMSCGQIQIQVAPEATLPPWQAEGDGTGSGISRFRARLAAASDLAVRLLRELRSLGFAPLLERMADDRLRLWIWSGQPTFPAVWNAVMVNVLERVGGVPVGVTVRRTPQRDDPDAMGSIWVVLPLGVDPRNRRSSVFIDETGEELSRAQIVKAWATPAPDPSALRAALKSRRPAELPPPERPLPELSPRAQAIVNKCAVLRALIDRAARLGHLEAEHRRFVLETLGPLPGNDGLNACVSVLSMAGMEAPAIRARVKRDDLLPSRCSVVRQTMPSLCQAVGCNCALPVQGPGIYPTPLLHEFVPSEVPSLVRLMARTEAHAAKRAAEAAAKLGSREASPAQSMPAPPAGATLERASGTDAASSAGPANGAGAPSASLPQSPAAQPSDAGITIRRSRADAPVEPASTELAAMAPDAPVPTSVDALVDQLWKLRRLRDRVTARVSTLEQRLEELFATAGTDRIRLKDSWLIRIPGDPPRYLIEI